MRQALLGLAHSFSRSKATLNVVVHEHKTIDTMQRADRKAHAGAGHITFFIKQLEELDMRQAQLGLAHSFSRGKVVLSQGC